MSTARMSTDGGAPVILIGPPGSGCRSVAAAWAARCGEGAQVRDLRAEVAGRLGFPEDLALIGAGEERYREVEAEVACSLLAALEGEVRAGGGAAPSAIALGSGCLGREDVREALESARKAGARLIALTANVRTLASRNGLDAPRSVALGPVNHAFTLMLHERNALCATLADTTVDTTDLTPEEAAAALGS